MELPYLCGSRYFFDLLIMHYECGLMFSDIDIQKTKKYAVWYAAHTNHHLSGHKSHGKEWKFITQYNADNDMLTLTCPE